MVEGARAEPGLQSTAGVSKRCQLSLAGWDIEDASVSIGGQETCLILPQLKIAFDIGRCPQRAVYMDTLCVSHCHMDHVGGAVSPFCCPSCLHPQLGAHQGLTKPASGILRRHSRPAVADAPHPAAAAPGAAACGAAVRLLA